MREREKKRRETEIENKETTRKSRFRIHPGTFPASERNRENAEAYRRRKGGKGKE
jgi:hypothetical protein